MISYFHKLTFILLTIVGAYLFYSGYLNLLIDDNYNDNVRSLTKPKIDTELKHIENIKKNIEIKKNTTKEINKKELTLDKVEIIVTKGDTFLSIINKFNIEDEKIFKIVNKIETLYDLKRLKVGDKMIFYKDLNENIKKIEIFPQIDKLLLVKIDDKILVEEKKFEKFYYQISKEFRIFNSLYSDGLKNDLPQDILIKLIKLYSFDLDFQRDIKKNTLVSVSYDVSQIKENDEIEYKDINYALLSIEGKKLEYFKFFTDDGYIDYFNRSGKNVKKSILKTPLDGARLSSNFGMRKHPISGYNKMHKGVDFAAPKGTPIYAGGNGVIEYVGNNGGYGKYIRIRHNNNYKTAYAHLSGYNKKISKGVRVNQGDIIGYVGNTGNSTGPHLHYEIILNGKQINPMKLKLPSGKTLKGEELKRFKDEYMKIYATHLNLLYE